MTLTEELGFRAQSLVARSEIAKTNPAMAEQVERDEAELLAITECLDEHPDGYDGPCYCRDCASYAT